MCLGTLNRYWLMKRSNEGLLTFVIANTTSIISGAPAAFPYPYDPLPHSHLAQTCVSTPYTRPGTAVLRLVTL